MPVIDTKGSEEAGFESCTPILLAPCKNNPRKSGT